jgi:hypothetical protein
MASRRSSQLSYSREVAEYNLGEPGAEESGGGVRSDRGLCRVKCWLEIPIQGSDSDLARWPSPIWVRVDVRWLRLGFGPPPRRALRRSLPGALPACQYEGRPAARADLEAAEPPGGRIAGPAPTLAGLTPTRDHDASDHEAWRFGAGYPDQNAIVRRGVSQLTRAASQMPVGAAAQRVRGRNGPVTEHKRPRTPEPAHAPGFCPGRRCRGAARGPSALEQVARRGLCDTR